MSWFIFSEVMFFGAFFGALFYARVLLGAGLGDSRATRWSGPTSPRTGPRPARIQRELHADGRLGPARDQHRCSCSPRASR